MSLSSPTSVPKNSDRKIVIANEVKQYRLIALRLPRTLRVLAMTGRIERLRSLSLFLGLWFVESNGLGSWEGAQRMGRRKLIWGGKPEERGISKGLCLCSSQRRSEPAPVTVRLIGRIVSASFELQ